MKRMKKLTSIMLIAAMAIGTASCGSKNDTPTDSPSTPTNAATATDTPSDSGSSGESETATEEEPQEETDPIFSDLYEAKDLGGREIIFAANWDDWKGNSATAEYPKEEDGNFENAVLGYENNRRIEEKYNITYKSINVPFADVTAQLATTALAGTPFCDVLFTEALNMVTLISAGFIAPTSEYMTENADALNEQLSTRLGEEICGDIYYFWDVQRREIEVKYLVANYDILNSLGTPDPMDLYNEGKWTFDAFLDICKQATKSTKGDGVIDQWGLGGWTGYILDCFVAANGGRKFDAGTLKQSMDSTETINALNFISKMLYEDKIWYNTGDIWAWDQLYKSFDNGRIAFGIAIYWIIQQAEELNFNWRVVPMPVGPDNKTGAMYFTEPKGCVIPRNVPDSQYVYQIYEEMVNWYGRDIELSLDESSLSWYTDLFQTQEEVDLVFEIGTTGGLMDLGNSIPDYDTGSILAPIINGEMTVMQAVEANKDSLQAAADILFGN